MTDIRAAIEKSVSYLTDHPEQARYTDSMARANLGESLRVEVEGPGGERIVTDMVAAVGGLAEHPSPGWLFRAAMASCVASTVAMEAARNDIELAGLVVEVDSESDDRGILGIDPATHVGPYSVRLRLRVTADGVDPERLREVVSTGAGLCPVCDATKRAVEVTVDIEVD